MEWYPTLPLLPWVREVLFFELLQGVTTFFFGWVAFFVVAWGLADYSEVYKNTGYKRYSQLERSQKLVRTSRYTLLAVLGMIVGALVGLGNVTFVFVIVVSVAGVVGVVYFGRKLVVALVKLLPNFFRSAMGKSV